MLERRPFPIGLPVLHGGQERKQLANLVGQVGVPLDVRINVRALRAAERSEKFACQDFQRIAAGREGGRSSHGKAVNGGLEIVCFIGHRGSESREWTQGPFGAG